MPLAACFYFFAENIIRYYLGADWMAVVPYLEVLSINAFFLLYKCKKERRTNIPVRMPMGISAGRSVLASVSISSI